MLLLQVSDSALRHEQLKRMLREELSRLGRITYHELSVLFLFVSLVLLWFFRDPQFIKGWGNFVHVE